jgi:hypothetical protein
LTRSKLRPVEDVEEILTDKKERENAVPDGHPMFLTASQPT